MIGAGNVSSGVVSRIPVMLVKCPPTYSSLADIASPYTEG